MLDTKPHLIICTEAWLKNCNIEMQQLEGYYLYSANEGNNKADGVILYADINLHQTTRRINIGGASALQTVINNQKKNTVITSIYRTHAINKENFNLGLYKYLQSIKSNEEHYIIGDINMDIRDPDQDGENYLNNLFENKFFPLINSTTRPSSGTCIDHIMGKNFVNVKSMICKQMITDHYVTILVLADNPRIKETKNYCKYINYNKLQHMAKNINWLQIIDNDNDIDLSIEKNC